MKKFNLIIALMIVQAAFFLVTCTKPTGTLTEIPLFEKDVWGEWIRMDNGENWYFAGNYRKVGNSFYASAVNMERQSENVIKVTEGSGVNAKEYYLYASRIRNSAFEATAVTGEETPSPARFSRKVFFGDKDVNAKVEAIQNALDEQTVTIGENGEIEADNIIAGDDYRVTIEGHEFIVTPQTDGDNVGTLTLTDGVNIKTSLVPWSSSVDMMRLYSGESYDMILRFTNIGEDICRAMEYELTLPEGIEVTEIGDSILASILPGTTREVELTIRCGMISDAFEFKTIEINTVDIDGKTWQDSVSVRVNKEPVVFNIRSSKAVNGVVIVPNGKTYYFKTAYLSSNLYAATVRVPKYQDDYLVVFSGATADGETRYSFAVDNIPAVNLDSLGLAALTKYRPNNTEALAAEILSSEEVYAYLPMNEANYYKVRFGN